jgi:microsomal dipeptidase-like Zn-dependent dipeptidase
MRKSRLALLVIFLLVVAFFALAPGYLDRSMNRVVSAETSLAVGEEAAALHARLSVVDLHADPLLWRRDLLVENDHGHVDLPRLEAGNVAIQVFAATTKSPVGQNYDSNPSDSDMLTGLVIANRQPASTWTSLFERALYQADKLAEMEARAQGRLKFLRSASDLEALVAVRAREGRPVGAVMALEGAHALEGRLQNLQGLFDAGYRVLGLAHFFDNEVSGSMHGIDKYGLTDFGRKVVAQAEAMGMIIDLAHASPAALAEVLASTSRPVIVSHGGVQATCKVNRNLSDEQIQAVAANNGLIGIGYWDGAVCDTSPEGIVAAMTHVRDLVGVSYIALGSDFDGSVVTRFDTSQLSVLTQALLDAGFSEEDIAAIMGGNALRLFYQLLPRE